MSSPFAIGLAAAACVIFALAILLFAYGKRQADSDALNVHLQRTIERQALGSGLGSPSDVVANFLAIQSTGPMQQKMKQWLRRIGAQAWGITAKQLWVLFGGGVLLFGWVWWKLGAALALVAFLVFSLCVMFYFWKKLERKRQKMLEQLPAFLDNMVRLITIGTSTQAAFQMSVAGIAEPLAGAMQQASAVLSASSNLGQALEALDETWGVSEFGLLGAVFRMSTKYGGRTDLVLERVSAYIRDKHAAERELHAMSAEVRMSAWILSLLPVVVGVLIMFLNDGYFLRMWNDEGGRQMIMLALGLELMGVALLYRLAKLR